LREEYESRVSDLNAEIERVRDKYEKQLNGKTNESNEQRDRAIVLQKELDETKKKIEALEGDNADLQDTVEAMEKNMSAVRADFASRADVAREETVAQKEEYEEQLEQLKNELDDKKKEAREVSHQNNVAKDTVRKLEQDLEVKVMMLDKAETEQQSVREIYEGRIDRMRAELQNSKEEHMKEIGDIFDENEKMKKELDEERMQKRSAEYRVRRLEEEVEIGKELLDQAKKATEESKEEYEVSSAPLNQRLVPTFLNLAYFVHCCDDSMSWRIL
jgi:chromosome segregation ATPase